MAFKTQVQFTEISTDQMTKDQQKLWAQYLAAKAAFGQSLQSSAPKGMKVLFSERYSRCKVGLVPLNGNGADSAKPKSLMDFLAEKAAAGEAA